MVAVHFAAGHQQGDFRVDSMTVSGQECSQLEAGQLQVAAPTTGDLDRATMSRSFDSPQGWILAKML